MWGYASNQPKIRVGPVNLIMAHKKFMLYCIINRKERNQQK